MGDSEEDIEGDDDIDRTAELVLLCVAKPIVPLNEREEVYVTIGAFVIVGVWADDNEIEAIGETEALVEADAAADNVFSVADGVGDESPLDVGKLAEGVIVCIADRECVSDCIAEVVA